MPIRSYANAFEIVDYTQELAIVPNSWTLLNDLGLFREEFLSQNTVTFEETQHTLGLLKDYVRGDKPQANKDDVRAIRAFPIPHFPIVDAVLPQDVQGKRAYGSQDQAETTEAVMARKIGRIRKNMDITLEVARFQTLTTGGVYAPNGTLVGNFYTDFGITPVTVDFDLDTPTADVLGSVETVIASMQDNAQTGDVINRIVGYVSPEFFGKLIAHPKVQQAYLYYSANPGQEILRNRAGNTGGLYRTFSYGGIDFVEVREQINGQRMLAANSAIFVPQGADESFVTYFGPANKFGYLNTVAERSYMWTYNDPKGERIDIEGEYNFINVLRRPQLVIRGTA